MDHRRDQGVGVLRHRLADAGPDLLGDMRAGHQDVVRQVGATADDLEGPRRQIALGTERQEIVHVVGAERGDVAALQGLEADLLAGVNDLDVLQRVDAVVRQNLRRAEMRGGGADVAERDLLALEFRNRGDAAVGHHDHAREVLRPTEAEHRLRAGQLLDDHVLGRAGKHQIDPLALEQLDRRRAAGDRGELDVVAGDLGQLVAEGPPFPLQFLQPFDVGNGEAHRLGGLRGDGRQRACQSQRADGGKAGELLANMHGEGSLG